MAREESEDTSYASDNTTLQAVVDGFERDGYGGQMAAREGGRVMCFTCRQEGDAETFDLQALRRTEGASDPADMAAVAALVCPNCEAKGTVVLKYGPEATVEEDEVLRRLDDNRDRSGGDSKPSTGS